NRNVNNIAVTPVLDLPGQEDKLLAVVYPNPVNEGSVLEINMPGTGKADISLINSAGQPVQRIFSGTLTKGNHIMELSDKIRHLPAGTYIIKIQTSNAIRSVKLMIQ
ncbi:MAG TPA: T9SS type A sorting domain-containing protein, partial [Chitinophagaceae bacterium]|nr:T9SS type A sorting domain-containing protein [Chitinophagaceae bacterium]